MKNISYKLLSISAFALITSVLMGGCKQPSSVIDEQMQITVDAAIDGTFDAEKSVVTKLNASGFEDGDQISFFAVKYTSGVPNEIGKDAATYIDNARYQRDGGLFKHFDGTTYVREFFPTDGSSIDIYGIYPFAESFNDMVAQPFKVQADQRTLASSYYNSDMMIAKTIKISPQPVPSKLVFHHLMSNVEIQLRLRNFDAGIDVSDVQLINFIADAKVNIASFNGTSATVTTGSTAPITITPRAITPLAVFSKAFTAIVPPQSLAKGAEVAQITLNTPNKDTYTLKLSNALVLESGKKHIFEVTVDFGTLPQIFVTAQIVPWTYTDVDGGTVEKEPDYKFKVILINELDNPAATTSIKLGVNGNRTFHLTDIVGYVPGAQGENSSVEFAIPGEGNRPGEDTGATKFTLNRLELLNAAETSFSVCQINPVIEVTAKGEMILYYDMLNKTISTTKP